MTTWLEAPTGAHEPYGVTLRAMLERPGCLGVPGAHDALSALLARRAGFEALYLSGAALSASMGLPDLGVISMEELVSTAKRIVSASALPLIVDGDTGYGEALNAMRLVRELEAAGAAAVQLEDQPLPKKCGHLSDKRLIPMDDMARKVEAARRASESMLIIARTDAAAVGIEEALTRARRYVDAGADVIFPEALTSDEDFRLFSSEIKAPILANMTEFGRTPYRTLAEFEALGAAVVIWPVSSLRTAAKAVEGLYAHLRSTGENQGMLEKMQSRADLYETIGYHDYEALDTSIARSTLPEE
jgi:methylisocitrate lyase